jgi:hypothetical protein
LVSRLWIKLSVERVTGTPNMPRLLLLLLSLLLLTATVIVTTAVTFFDRSPTYRAGVVLLQPEGHTLAVEPVLTRQHSHFVTYVQLVDADGALGFAIRAQILELHGPLP